MSAVRGVSAKVDLARQRVTAGFSSSGLRAGGAIQLDPFLNLDDFVMSEPTFPPHPHAGFSAVTYMFEDSAGSFVNRDSLGDPRFIAPGALHWTQAARGMMHEERPSEPGTRCHGLQMFVNLRSDHKNAAPRAFHVAAAEIPEVRPTPGARVRVLVGACDGVASPLDELLTPITFLDVHLETGAVLELDAPAASTAFALVVRGTGLAGRQGQETSLAVHAAAGFSSDGDVVRLVGGEGGLQVLFGAGAPLREPVVFGGPFVMTSTEEVRAAEQRFRRGEMGKLAPSGRGERG